MLLERQPRQRCTVIDVEDSYLAQQRLAKVGAEGETAAVVRLEHRHAGREEQRGLHGELVGSDRVRAAVRAQHPGQPRLSGHPRRDRQDRARAARRHRPRKGDDAGARERRRDVRASGCECGGGRRAECGGVRELHP